MATASPPSNVTVIVPLFPRHPGLRHALATLRAQTVRPDLVVLLDDGRTPETTVYEKELPGVPVQVAQVDTADVADAINRAVDFLDHSKYIAIIGAGGAYAPQRLERCLAAIEDPSRFRQPGIVVTGAIPVDSRGIPLAEGDERYAQLARLWFPGRQGVGIPEWLGAGDFQCIGAIDATRDCPWFNNAEEAAAWSPPNDIDQYWGHEGSELLKAGLTGSGGVDLADLREEPSGAGLVAQWLVTAVDLQRGLGVNGG
jgi:glycosyltransferase involved in cell wall biosynthesis